MFREAKAWLKCFCTKYETIAHAQEATRQLNMFVGSAIFVDACGRHASDAIQAWLANGFFVHAESLFFVYRKHLRCFDVYINSVVEQQHAAVKTVWGIPTLLLCFWRIFALPPVLFCKDKYRYEGHLHSLDTLVRCMNFKAEIKVMFLFVFEIKVMFLFVFVTSCLRLHIIGQI
jgi:hypothetical protein